MPRSTEDSAEVGSYISKLWGVSKALFYRAPALFDKRRERSLCRVDENSFRSANQIRTAANFPGSFRKVMNRLRDANIYCRRAASKEGITDGQEKRL